MKNLFFLAAVFSLPLSTVSCKSKKEATTSDSSSSSASANAAANEPKEISYRLIVSFISKGAGTGPKRTEFLDYVAANPKKPAYKEVHWGREGETDYCFTLSEFKSKTDLEKFIDGVKKIASESDLISLSENAPCPHKGR